MTQPDEYIEWPTYPVHVRRGGPSAGGSFEKLAAYAEHLRVVGAPDPTRVAGLVTAAMRVRDVAADDPTLDAASFADRVAGGHMSPKKALDEMGRRPHPDDVRMAAVRRQQDATNLVSDLLQRAWREIHEYGEGWLDMLKPIAADAVQTGNEQLWHRCHEFAGWLRDPKWVGVRALSAVMPNETDDAGTEHYMFGRPKAVYVWRVERSAGNDITRTNPTVTPSGKAITAYGLRPDALWPSFHDICAHADEWQPGLYSAEEALDNILRDVRRQDEDITELMGPHAIARDAAFG
jgi:hypothetical protein